jgi:hypothetical protein
MIAEDTVSQHCREKVQTITKGMDLAPFHHPNEFRVRRLVDRFGFEAVLASPRIQAPGPTVVSPQKTMYTRSQKLAEFEAQHISTHLYHQRAHLS